MRQCKYCGNLKEINEFVGQKKYGIIVYRYKCKECKNADRRTGLPNTGRFQKGKKSIGKTFQKGHIPWHAGKKKLNRKPNKDSTNRFSSEKYRIWKKEVFRLDNNKCARCGSKYKLAAHHILSWEERPDLRFEVKNGLTLCCVCHGKEEGFQKGRLSTSGFQKNHVPWNKGLKIKPN